MAHSTNTHAAFKLNQPTQECIPGKTERFLFRTADLRLSVGHDLGFEDACSCTT